VTNRAIGNYARRSLWPVFLIVVESGAIYTLSSLAVLITYLLNSAGYQVVLSAMSAIAVSSCLYVTYKNLDVDFI
jgi:hypothetical protein